MFRRRTSSDNDARILIANSLVDIDPDYAVSASDLPNRGTGGSGYDLDTNVGTAANRKIHPSGSCLLFGASGDYASTPDTAGNSITGDIDIRARASLESWSTAGQSLVAKYNSTGGQRSYLLDISTSGALRFLVSTDGTSGNIVAATSSEVTGFSAGSENWVRATWDQSESECIFYTSDNGVDWTQLGTAQTLTASGAFDSSAAVTIGAIDAGANNRLTGYVSRAQIYNGIDGTLAVDFDPTNYVSGTTFNTTMSDELVTNGGFDADSDWAKGTGWSIASGVATHSGSAGGITQNILTVGRTYAITFDLIRDGSFNVYAGTNVTSISTDGTHTVVLQATGSGVLQFYGGNNYTLDNVSVVEVTPWTLNGNSFIQNTGHDVLHSIGSNGLETAAGQTINAPGTVFAVAKFSQASPSASQAIFAARSLNTARWTILSDDSNADKFTLIEGSVIALSEAYDTDPHIFTAQFNGDATTKLTVSGVGSVTGDAGAHDWDFGTILARFDGNITMQGYIARLLVFNYALSETQVSAIKSYLSAYYSL